MTLEERSKLRRMRDVRRSKSLEEAEEWDLNYWQSMTQAERLQAYLAIRARHRKSTGITPSRRTG